MHRDDFVVTLRHESSNETYREYRNEHIRDSDTRQYRYREVRIPYNSHYRFAFKNMKNVRRRIEITIDGSLVGDWIVPAGSRSSPSETFIERFAETPRKFKVVHPDDPDVADPGSSDNGLVTVRVWSENQAHLVKKLASPEKGTNWPTNPSPFWTSSVLRGAGGQSFSSQAVVHNNVSYSMDAADVGRAATVEGAYSNQQFQTTTWAGDSGAPLEFEFRIIGKGEADTAQPIKKTTSPLLCIKFRVFRDRGKTVKNTKIALEQLGFNELPNLGDTYTIYGAYEGDLEVLRQLKGVKEIQEAVFS